MVLSNVFIIEPSIVSVKCYLIYDLLVEAMLA
jgi:hypothetical protein